MSNGHPVALLMYGTLAIALIIAVVILARFLSKRRNRHPMDGVRERNIDEIQRGVPPRAE